MTERTVSAETTKFVNRTNEYVFATQDRGLVSSRLDLSTVYFSCYGDESLATNTDLICQMGGIVCLRDAENNIAFLAWHSKKFPRVVSSILACETIAAVTNFNLIFEIRHTLSEVIGRRLDFYTDTYCMFLTVTK